MPGVELDQGDDHLVLVVKGNKHSDPPAHSFNVVASVVGDLFNSEENIAEEIFI